MSPPSAEIYVNDILGAAVSKKWILKLLATNIESIFIVCGHLHTDVCQCPISLKKWSKSIVGPRQIILSLVIDTNETTVKISDEYLDEVWLLITKKWNPKRKISHVNKMQKLVGELACFGEVTHWVYKLMLHLYTSLASVLKMNK